MVERLGDSGVLCPRMRLTTSVGIPAFRQCEGVAQVVEANGWQAGPADQPTEALAHGVRVEGLPVLATEESW